MWGTRPYTSKTEIWRLHPGHDFGEKKAEVGLGHSKSKNRFRKKSRRLAGGGCRVGTGRPGGGAIGARPSFVEPGERGPKGRRARGKGAVATESSAGRAAGEGAFVRVLKRECWSESRVETS